MAQITCPPSIREGTIMVQVYKRDSSIKGRFPDQGWISCLRLNASIPRPVSASRRSAVRCGANLAVAPFVKQAHIGPAPLPFCAVDNRRPGGERSAGVHCHRHLRSRFLAGNLFRQPNRKPSQSLALRWTLSITVQPAAAHELGTHWSAEPFAWPLAPSRWSRTIPPYWDCGRTVESDCW